MVFARTAMRNKIKLGSRQKSKRKYVKARGRHNKIRQSEKSRPVKVQIGFKNKVVERGLVNGKVPILVYNVQDLSKVGKENIVLLGKIGMKNKIEIAREAEKNKLEIFNLNVKKLLKFANKSKEKVK